MPLGEYEDFDACVSAQREKGHDMDSAQKICGEIQKRVEGMRSFRFDDLSLDVVNEHEPDIWPAQVESKNQQLDVYIHDVIGPSMTGESVTSMDLVPRIETAAANGIGTIRCNINTVGGSVAHAMSIFNAFQGFTGQVLVDVTGQAGSSGGIIATAGHKIRIHENATFYLHPANVSLLGANENLLNLGLELVQKGTDQIASLLSIRSGQTKEKVLDLMNAKGGYGTTLTGKEAVELGFADELVAVKPKQDRMRAVLEIMQENSRSQAALIRNKIALS